jgi:hypothetical protein
MRVGMSNLPKHYPGSLSHSRIASRRAAAIALGEQVTGVRESDPEYRSPEERGEEPCGEDLATIDHRAVVQP